MAGAILLCTLTIEDWVVAEEGRELIARRFRSVVHADFTYVWQGHGPCVDKWWLLVNERQQISLLPPTSMLIEPPEQVESL